MATFVNNLSNICTNSDTTLKTNLQTTINNPTAGLGTRSSVNSTKLGGLHPNDFFLYTHNYGNKEYVTYKMGVADLEWLLYKFRLAALSTDLSSLFNLRELAHMNKTDLNLGDLSEKSYVISSDIRHMYRTETSERSLPKEMIDIDWREEAKTHLADLSSEQGFGSLAFKNTIGYTALSVDLKNDKWPLNELVNDAGNLAKLDQSDLNLSTLAHVGKINLDVNYRQDGRGDDTYIYGRLDFPSGIKNYEPTISALVLKYLPLATDNETGVVKTGSICPNTSRPRQYPIQMDGKNSASPSALFVDVPWTDVNTFSKYELTAGGNNTLIFTEYNVDESLYALSSTPGGKKMNIRDHKVSEPIRKTIQFTPYIERNVVLNKAIQVNVEHNQCLAKFSADKSHLVIEDGPSFDSTKTDEYLAHDGTWKQITLATRDKPGLMTAEDKKFVGAMQSLQENLAGNFYELSVASPDILGGIKTGYTANYDAGKYPVRLDAENRAYVQILNPISQYQSSIGQIADNSVTDMLKSLYPVGAIYITAADSCPLRTLIPGSEWIQVSKGKCLWGYTGSNPKLGTEIKAGLPNHWHSVEYQVANCGCGKDGGIRSSHSSSSKGSASTSTATTAAASSGIYGNSTTVQPPAYVVNIFQRTK